MKLELEKAEIHVDKIRSINEQIKVIKSEMADHRLEGILEVRGILTADQFKKFQAFKDHDSGVWGGKHKGGKGDYKKHYKSSKEE